MNMIDKVAKAIRDAEDRCYSPAHAAIKAMREPTDEMIRVGSLDSDMSAKRIWREMIDEALKE